MNQNRMFRIVVPIKMLWVTSAQGYWMCKHSMALCVYVSEWSLILHSVCTKLILKSLKTLALFSLFVGGGLLCFTTCSTCSLTSWNPLCLQYISLVSGTGLMHTRTHALTRRGVLGLLSSKHWHKSMGLDSGLAFEAGNGPVVSDISLLILHREEVEEEGW